VERIIFETATASDDSTLPVLVHLGSGIIGYYADVFNSLYYFYIEFIRLINSGLSMFTRT
jgi:hypothetical protein